MLRPVLKRQELVPFDYRYIKSLLFSNTEQGAFYVPAPVIRGSQILFTDDAGTIPVTADGDPVGLMLDLSGNGNHASQATSAARPLYRTDGALHWLEFDGVDDRIGVVYPSSLSQPNTLAIAFRYLGGTRVVGRSEGAGQGQLVFQSGSNLSWYAGNVAGSLPPATGEDTVMTGMFDGASSKYRRNGSAYQTVDSGVNGTAGPYIGADSNGNASTSMLFYGLISADGDNTSDLDNVQSYLANLAGIQI